MFKKITLKKSLNKMGFKLINSFNILILLQFCFLEIFIPRNIIASQKPNIEYLKKAPINDFYILGPGDVLRISVSDNSDLLNQEFSIDINGQASLLRLNKVYVSGLTIPELTDLLNKAYSEYVISPNVNLGILRYKPVELLIEGEVSNPGKYTLPKTEKQQQISNLLGKLPTLIDVIQESGGLTENADLKNIVVIRNNNLSNGGGKIKSTINLYSALDGSAPGNNINIFNGDKIIVPFTDKPMVSEIKQVMLNNLNPQLINVFVAGKVERPGLLKVSNAAVLTEAIALAGGTKIIKGPVRFLRYKSNGKIDKRKFAFRRDAKRGSYRNPYLRDGDVITIGKNTFNVASEIIGEVTAPLQGLVTTYGLYKVFAD